MLCSIQKKKKTRDATVTRVCTVEHVSTPQRDSGVAVGQDFTEDAVIVVSLGAIYDFSSNVVKLMWSKGKKLKQILVWWGSNKIQVLSDLCVIRMNSEQSTVIILRKLKNNAGASTEQLVRIQKFMYICRGRESLHEYFRIFPKFFACLHLAS